MFAMARNPMIISPPRLTWLIVLGLAGFLAGGGSAPARAQQFSANLVTTHVDGTAIASHLRVFNNKVRIETPEFPDGFFLIDGVSRAAYFARPGQGVFMDARQSSRLTRLFVPVDLGDPCLQWQEMAMLAGVAVPSPPGGASVSGRNCSRGAVSLSTGRYHPPVGISLDGSIRASNFR
jgi:hypothetical protein